jgi:uncharacterized membrane protein (DUF2068 family)
VGTTTIEAAAAAAAAAEVAAILAVGTLVAVVVSIRRKSNMLRHFCLNVSTFWPMKSIKTTSKMYSLNRDSYATSNVAYIVPQAEESISVQYTNVGILEGLSYF